MNKQTQTNIKNLCCIAMITAMAIVVNMFLRVHIDFLTYEPKDAIIAIGGFIFGPLTGILISLIVCLIEFVTISTTGPIGLLMNFLSSAVFVGISTLIYSRKKTLSRAITGLIIGGLSAVVIMLLWNYIITPIYTGIPREAVLDMFMPLLIPFNLLKYALNSTVVLILYKGVVTALRKSHLLPESNQENKKNFKKDTIVLFSICSLLIITLIILLLIFAKII